MYCNHRFIKVKTTDDPHNKGAFVVTRVCKRCPKVIVTSITIDFTNRNTKVRSTPYDKEIAELTYKFQD